MELPERADPDLVRDLCRRWPHLPPDRAELAARRMEATLGGAPHGCPERLAVLPRAAVGARGARDWYTPPANAAENVPAAAGLIDALRWDERAGRPVWCPALPSTPAAWLAWGTAPAPDVGVEVARELSARHDLFCTLDNAHRYAEAVALADRERHLDPVRGWLEAVAAEHPDLADGERAAAELRGVGRLLGAAPDDVGADEIVTRWMLGGVARALWPGCAVDQTLVLAGAPGLGKTKGLHLLCGGSLGGAGGWAVSAPLPDLGDKRGAELAAAPRALVWIVDEGAGLTGGGPARRRAVSDFLTRTEDTYRAAYGRHAKTTSRRCVFAVTLNPEAGERLLDHERGTGARRFALVPVVQRVNLAEVERRAPRLWAAALAMVRAWEARGRAVHAPWALDPDTEAMLVARLEAADRARGALEHALHGPIGRVLRADIGAGGAVRPRTLAEWMDALEVRLGDRPRLQRELATALRALGLDNVLTSRADGPRCRRWAPPADPAAWCPELRELVAPEPEPPTPPVAPSPTPSPRAAAPPAAAPPAPTPSTSPATGAPPAARGRDRPPPDGGARGGGR